MESHKSFLQNLSRLFPSSLSFDSCRSLVVTDVAHSPVVITKSKKIPKPENTYSDQRTRAAAEGFETATFYSLSLNSGDSSRPKTTWQRPTARRREETETIDEMGSDHASTRTYYDSGYPRRRSGRKSGGVIEEGLAVERWSSDPYSDFMASMAEMIIEKQMFGAEDLDRLLYRFLALNEVKYHGIIFRVYSEICHIFFCE